MDRAELIPFGILAIIISFVFNIVKYYRKTKYNMEPVHVFQLNFMSVSTFLVFSPFIVAVIKLFGAGNCFGGYCPNYFYGFFAETCFNIDIVLMQIDRFLALYWDLLYKDRVTTNMALSACFLSKVFAIMLTTSIGYLDKEYSKCTYQCKYSLFHLKTTNIYLDAYPKLVAISILVAVSMYVIYTIIKLRKKVQPLITLPTVSNIVQDQVQPLVNLPTVSNIVHAQEEVQQDVNIIRRIDEDPNMFYEVAVDNNQVPNDDLPTPCFNTNNQIFLVAKEALNLNLLTLVLIIIYVPTKILAIWFHTGDHARYMLWYRTLIPFQFICSFIYLILIFQKIK